MTLSEQQAPMRALVAFKKYAKGMDARISEALPEDRPTPRPAHAAGSWHYERGTYLGVIHSKAADVNYGPPGAPASEREMCRHLIAVAQSMGLGVIYALNGTTGTAGQHRDHLHVDVGSVSNLGTGNRAATPGDLVVWDTQPLIRARQDNLALLDTRKRLIAIREASALGGHDFPFGVKFTQDAVGASETGTWTKASALRHDATVKRLKTSWKKAGLFRGVVNTVWDPEMDKALARFMNRYA